VKKLYSAVEIDLKTRFVLWNRRRNNQLKDSNVKVQLSSSGGYLKLVVFLLPNKNNFMRIAEYFIRSIKQSNYSGTEIRFVCSKEANFIDDNTVNTGVSMYDSEDLDKWGLPSLHFEKQIRDLHAEGFVDLDPEFNPVNASLAIASNSPIRIGFESSLANYYYNITLSTKEPFLLEKSYKKIENLLGLA